MSRDLLDLLVATSCSARCSPPCSPAWPHRRSAPSSCSGGWPCWATASATSPSPASPSGCCTGTSPTWTAVVVAILGAVLIEVIREHGHTNGDVALALLFYGGLAGGVLITGLAGQGAARLQAYLFGS